MKTTILILLFLFTASVSYPQTTVKGVVFGEKSLPVPGVKVIVEGGGTTTTDKSGAFSLSINKTPYTLTIIDTISAVAIRYEDIITKELELRIFGEQRKRKLSNIQTIDFQFPKIPDDKTIIVRFLCNEQHISKERLLKKGSTSVSLTVEWPVAKESISGMVVFLEKTKTGYSRYSQYVVTLLKDFNLTKNIDLDLVPNLTPLTIPGNVNNNNTTFNQENSSESGGGLKILSPEDEFVHYDTTLLFAYGMEFGTGIYIVSFVSPLGNFHIVTSSINVKKPRENSYGMLRGNRCQWYVEKNTFYPGVDEYLSKEGYRKSGSISRSESRTFWLL